MTVSVDFILFMRLLPLEMPVEMETVWTAPTAQLIRASCAHVRLCGSSSTAKHKRALYAEGIYTTTLKSEPA